MNTFKIKYIANGEHGESVILAKNLTQAKRYFFDVWGFTAWVYDIDGAHDTEICGGDCTICNNGETQRETDHVPGE